MIRLAHTALANHPEWGNAYAVQVGPSLIAKYPDKSTAEAVAAVLTIYQTQPAHDVIERLSDAQRAQLDHHVSELLALSHRDVSRFNSESRFRLKGHPARAKVKVRAYFQGGKPHPAKVELTWRSYCNGREKLQPITYVLDLNTGNRRLASW